MVNGRWEHTIARYYLGQKIKSGILACGSGSILQRYMLPKIVENPFKKFNHINKCIFIHIPKCAGNTVQIALFGTKKISHRRIIDYIVHDKERCGEYTKFTFVRNPWDRIVSAYHYLERGGKHDKDAEWYSKFIDGMSFREFILSLENDRYRKRVLGWVHFMPQVDWLKDFNGEVCMDYVGQVEAIENDLDEVAQKLGLSVDKVPHVNNSKRLEYRSYFDDNTREIVSRVYADDIHHFKYSY